MALAGRMTFTTEQARAYVAEVRWQFAKTMPQWPHEYTVRRWRPDLEREFFGFVELIRRDGVVKPWPRDAADPRYRLTYLELDGWEYWSMGAPVSETTVINRAVLTPDGPPSVTPRHAEDRLGEAFARGLGRWIGARGGGTRGGPPVLDLHHAVGEFDRSVRSSSHLSRCVSGDESACPYAPGARA